MATYISLIKFTQQGIATIKDGPARLDSGKETLEALSSELKAFYLTIGRLADRDDVIAALTMRPRRRWHWRSVRLAT